VDIDAILSAVGDANVVQALREERERLLSRVSQIDKVLALAGPKKTERVAIPRKRELTQADVKAVEDAIGDGKVNNNTEISRATGLLPDLVTAALVKLRTEGKVIHSGHQGRGSVWQLATRRA
jgi:predicted Rossmann fold nucleotide-binding protein DprA/Smf involved in DNA uptake